MKKLVLTLFGILLPIIVLAAPVSLYNERIFRDFRGPNSIGWPSGDNLIFSVHVDPVDSIDGRTTVGAYYDGYILNLGYVGGVPADEFATSIPYDPSLTGSWLIRAQNGPNIAEGYTNYLGDVPQLPFVSNVKVGKGLTPVFSWKNPEGTIADRVLINLIDAVTGLRIWWSNPLDLASESFAFEPGLLEYNHPYVVRILLEATNDSTLSGSMISRATTFIDYTPLDESVVPDSVYLPTMLQDSVPNDEYAGEYTFNCDVSQGESIFIDPYIAIGYEYKVGIDDPNFASVTLPEIGDNLFDIYLYDGKNFYLAAKDINAGEPIKFGPEGVKKFRILGIEETANLDPLDVTAFITELTFTQTGKFTGSMIPIINIDNDDDGIQDYQDNCRNSDLSATVVIGDCDSNITNILLSTGCTISDKIAVCAEKTFNHGKFISCVSHLTNDLKKAGTITGWQKGAIQSCAGQADIP